MVLCTEHLCWDKRYFWDDIYRSRSSCFSRGDIVNSPSMEYLSRYPLIHYRARSLKIKWERSRTSRSLAWDFERSRLRCLKKDLARGFSERGEMWYRSKRVIISLEAQDLARGETSREISIFYPWKGFTLYPTSRCIPRDDTQYSSYFTIKILKT